MNTATAHTIDCKKKVTVYHTAAHTPAQKRDDVNYVQVEGRAGIHAEVKQIVGTLEDKIMLTPAYSDNSYSPNPIGGYQNVAITMVSKKDALDLMGKKNLTEKAKTLALSILWGVNRQSFV